VHCPGDRNQVNAQAERFGQLARSDERSDDHRPVVVGTWNGRGRPERLFKIGLQRGPYDERKRENQDTGSREEKPHGRVVGRKME